MIHVIEKPQKTIICLEPNRSATWQQTKTAILGLSAFMMVIGIGWLIAGVWIILPFVLLDILVFSYFFYRVCEATYRRQLIIIEPKAVCVQSGIRQLGSIKKFQRPCYLLIHKRRSPSHLEDYSLVDDDEVQSIGSFLNEDDLKHLRLVLGKYGFLEINQEWWKSKTTVNRLHY
jgi:uncharacterized membrane protein|tara:strand:+ start:4887 stop:5408 length:522 start_codon:yes stop_codon:yes gene_type:complete